MKKIISLALVFIFVIALAVPAFAADVTTTIIQNNPITDPNGAPSIFEDKQQITDITYDVSGAYIVTIPAAITLSFDGVDKNVASAIQYIGVKDVLIPYGKELTITLTSARTLVYDRVANDDIVEDTITYGIYNTKLVDGNYYMDETSEIRDAGGLGVDILVINGGGKSAIAEGKGSASGEIRFGIKTTSLPRYNQRYKGSLTFDITVADAPIL